MSDLLITTLLIVVILYLLTQSGWSYYIFRKMQKKGVKSISEKEQKNGYVFSLTSIIAACILLVLGIINYVLSSMS